MKRITRASLTIVFLAAMWPFARVTTKGPSQVVTLVDVTGLVICFNVALFVLRGTML